MKELRRWSEEGATAEELRLVASAQALRPSAATRARLTAALGAGSSVLLASSASALTQRVAGVTKLVGVVLAVGGVASVAWRLSHPAAPPMALKPAASSVSVPLSAPLAPKAAEPPTTEVPEANNERTETERRPASAARAAPSASAGLSEEVAALGRVRQALAAGAAEEALRELRAYAQRFPRGALSSEATVLRVQALLADGKGASAVALADKFSALHPESPLARRLQALVRTARSAP